MAPSKAASGLACCSGCHRHAWPGTRLQTRSRWRMEMLGICARNNPGRKWQSGFTDRFRWADPATERYALRQRGGHQHCFEPARRSGVIYFASTKLRHRNRNCHPGSVRSGLASDCESKSRQDNERRKTAIPFARAKLPRQVINKLASQSRSRSPPANQCIRSGVYQGRTCKPADGSNRLHDNRDTVCQIPGGLPQFHLQGIAWLPPSRRAAVTRRYHPHSVDNVP